MKQMNPRYRMRTKSIVRF